MTLPSPLVPWIPQQFFTAEGLPLAGGFIYTYAAGTSTPKALYTDSDRVTAHANPVELDANGRPPSPMYMAAGGYKFVVTDADLVQLYTVDNVEDVGLTYLEGLGVTLATGSSSVPSGFTVTAADAFITVASTGGANPCVVNLPLCAERTTALGIKNVGTVPLAVTPYGSDTIDGVAGAFVVPPASGGLYPAIYLLPDGVSNWLIMGSHALAVPRQVQGSAAPTTGTWAAGDIVWRIDPAAAQSPGWICVVAGTPGTWKTMAILGA